MCTTPLNPYEKSRKGAAFCFRQNLENEKKGEQSEGGIETVSEPQAVTSEQGKCARDQPVGDPIYRSANGNRQGADGAVKKFAEHEPHHRSPGYAESDREKIDRDESGNAGLG